MEVMKQWAQKTIPSTQQNVSLAIFEEILLSLRTIQIIHVAIYKKEDLSLSSGRMKLKSETDPETRLWPSWEAEERHDFK